MGRKNRYWDFSSGNLDFGLEKLWKNHGAFFLVFCVNPVKNKVSLKHMRRSQKRSSVKVSCELNAVVNIMKASYVRILA